LKREFRCAGTGTLLMPLRPEDRGDWPA